MKTLTAFTLGFLSLQLSMAAPNPLANPAFMPAGGLGPVSKPGVNVLPNKPAVSPACQSCTLDKDSVAGGCQQQCLSKGWTSLACKTCLGPDMVTQLSACANCYAKASLPPVPAAVKPKPPPTDAKSG